MNPVPSNLTYIPFSVLKSICSFSGYTPIGISIKVDAYLDLMGYMGFLIAEIAFRYSTFLLNTIESVAWEKVISDKRSNREINKECNFINN
jgi:hypothetical protein